MYVHPYYSTNSWSVSIRDLCSISRSILAHTRRMDSTLATHTHQLLVLLIAIGLLSQIKGSCDVVLNSANASSAVHGPDHEYPKYSCTSCDDPTVEEVHILNIYQPTGTTRGFRQQPDNVKTVKVNVVTSRSVRIKLFLLNYEATNWLIDKPINVYISQILLMSHFSNHGRVQLEDKESINVEKRFIIFQSSENMKIIDYASTQLGTVTSYSAIGETLEWWLTVGNCSNITAQGDGQTTTPTYSTPQTTTPDMSDCVYLWKKPCWVSYKFHYESYVNECQGPQYITEYHLDKVYYIGARLCTTTRYSLFMSTSLHDTFLPIVDTNGRCEDHCAVVGLEFALRSRAVTDPVRIQKSQLVFYRRHWGDAFKKRTVKSGMNSRWYECGITIPMADKVPLPTTESPSSPSKNRSSFNVVAFVCIIGGLLIAFIITMLFLRGCRKNNRHEADYAMAIQRRQVQSTPTQSTVIEPSAPDLPRQNRNLLPPHSQEGTLNDAPPPAYEDIMNYPIAKSTTPAPPVYNPI